MHPAPAPRDPLNGNTIYARAAAYFTFYAKYSAATRPPPRSSEFRKQLIV